MGIDFTLSPEQRELQLNARSFADSVLAGVAERLDAIRDPAQAFHAQRDVFTEFAKAGFTKSFIPKEYGGLGFRLLDFAIAVEEIARVDVNVATTLLGNAISLQPVLQFGSADQCKRFLPPFVDDPDGSVLAAYGFTDVGGAANFDCEDPSGGVQTIARAKGDRLVVNGEKQFTVNGTGWGGTGCHLYTVVCRTDASKGASESLAVVEVPGDAPGVEIVEALDKLGHRGVDTPRVRFHDVEVPADNLLGRPGQGKQIVWRAFSWTGCVVGAASVGVMRAAFDYAHQFCMRERRHGTVPIIEHQNVGYMLANARMRIEAARYLTWKACHYADTTDNRGEELAIMAKVYCSEACVQTIYDLMQVVGVESYTTRTPLERLLRDAIVFPLYDGSNMGIRRKQLHEILCQGDYDQMLAVEGRVLPTPALAMV
jgi:alkylation response protein AidB-like acyl-CoA dehydrogenase